MKTTALALLLTCAAAVVNASPGNADDIGESCNVEFASDVRISPAAVEFTSTTGAPMVIDADDRLFVDDEEVLLDESERAAVAAYAADVRRTVPKIVELALEGVEIGLAAVTEAFYALADAGPPQSLLDAIDRIQEGVASKMLIDGNVVEVKGGEIGLEDAMDGLSPALSDAVSDAIGELVIAVGQSLKEGEGSLLDRMAGFSTRMAEFEETVESRVAAKAKALEERAQGLCDQIYALQASESALHVNVPQTRQFDLVKEA